MRVNLLYRRIHSPERTMRVVLGGHPLLDGSQRFRTTDGPSTVRATRLVFVFFSHKTTCAVETVLYVNCIGGKTRINLIDPQNALQLLRGKLRAGLFRS